MGDIVAICCMCEKVRNDLAGRGQEQEVWVEFGVYLADHGLRGTELRLSHSYCPRCLDAYREVLVLEKQELRDPKQRQLRRAGELADEAGSRALRSTHAAG